MLIDYVRGASVEVGVRIIDAEGCADCVSPRSAAESAAHLQSMVVASDDALTIQLCEGGDCYTWGLEKTIFAMPPSPPSQS